MYLDLHKQSIFILIICLGKYNYLELLLGLSSLSNISYVINLVRDLEYIQTYLDNLSYRTYDSFMNYLNKIEILIRPINFLSISNNLFEISKIYTAIDSS